jgi:hypothetical protein
MNEDKLKGKNHNFSIFSQLQELYGKYSIQDGKESSNGESIMGESNQGIKWKEPNTHNITEPAT